MDVKREQGSLVRKNKLVAILKQSGVALMCATLGAVMGRAELIFGAVPFGFALLCVSSGYAPAALAGLILSSAFRADYYAYLGAYVLTALLRVAFGFAVSKEKKAFRPFYEPVSLRAVSAAIGATALCVYKLVRGGWLYYDLFGVFISLAVAALGTVLWYSLSLARESKGAVSNTVWRGAGYVSFMCALVFSLRDLQPYGISLSALACMLVTLFTTRKRGIAFGSLTAILSGLCVSVTYAPLFAFAAVGYGFLSMASATLGVFGAFAVGMLWGLYTEGISSFLKLLPALMAATLLFFVIERLFLTTPKQQTASERSEGVESKASAATVAVYSDMTAVRLDDTAKRIKSLCEGLSSLSVELLGAESGAPCANVRASSCAPSVLTAQIGDEVVLKKSSLRSNGKARTAKERSYSMSEMSELDGAVSEHTQSYAYELRAFCDYLASIMTQGEKEYVLDTALAKSVSSELSRICGEGFCVSAFGAERRRIVVSCDSYRRLCANARRICRAVSDACDATFECDEPFELDGRAYMTLRVRPALRAVCAGRRRSAPCESEYCGDSFGIVEDADNGKTFVYISDGMGSGRQASVASQICSTFLRCLLPIESAGGDCVVNTLTMINGYLRDANCTSESECSASVDLGVLDLANGRAGFYKSGAAPTYIFRDGALFKLRARTVPVGIIKEPDLERINMELLPGDVIVMISDGITEGREECPELFEFLRTRLLTHSADALADAVMDFADQNSFTDDVSVVVVKIEEQITK